MRRIGLSAVMAAGLLLFGERAGAAVLVPFTDVYGSIVVRVMVDGKGPYDFAVDTGTWDTVVTPSLARELRLVSTGSRIEGGAGPREMNDSLTRLASVSTGGLVASDLPADEVELPDRLVHRIPGITIRGLIGCDFLRRFVATIDYSTLTLTFSDAAQYRPAKRAIALPMRMIAGGIAPGVAVAVDGHPATFMVDTGNSGWPDIKRAFAASTKLDAQYDGEAKPLTAQAAGGNAPERAVCLRSFSIGGWQRSSVPAGIDVADYGVSRWSDNDGSIGYETLRPFRASFDFTRKMLYLDRAPFVASIDYATTLECMPKG